jgi:hypothetical protein
MRTPMIAGNWPFDRTPSADAQNERQTLMDGEG